MENWKFERTGSIGRLVMRRSQSGYTLDRNTLQELGEWSRERAADPDGIKALIVSSEGRHFCAGVDVNLIAESLDLPVDEYKAALRMAQIQIDDFERLPFPTIAAIGGFCIGGGLILALCCDFRVASPQSIFLLPEVKRGIGVLMGTSRVVRAVGAARAKEMIMLGERLAAPKALDWGLVHYVHADPSAKAAALAAKLSALPATTLSDIKLTIDSPSYEPLAASQRLEIELQTLRLESHNMREGVASFLENRPPNFE